MEPGEDAGAARPESGPEKLTRLGLRPAGEAVVMFWALVFLPMVVSGKWWAMLLAFPVATLLSFCWIAWRYKV